TGARPARRRTSTAGRRHCPSAMQAADPRFGPSGRPARSAVGYAVRHDVEGAPAPRGARPVTRADAVVVGAGVIGASCAVHLARAGLRVTIVDRATGPGGGSTARATGGFRAQYATAINIRLSLLAREHLRGFRDDTGVDPGFQPVGYLWLATTANEL